MPKGRFCLSGQNQMCHLCGWLKLFLKKCGGEKNKKHRVGLSVGLLAVPFEYVRYVGHLSKWFVFVLMFKFWSVCRLVNGRPTIGYNVFGLGEGGDLHHKVDAENQTLINHKCVCGALNRHFCQTRVSSCAYFCINKICPHGIINVSFILSLKDIADVFSREVRSSVS